MSIEKDTSPTPSLNSVYITATTAGTAPDTAITSKPQALTNSMTATFGFMSTEPNSTFACSLDNAAFAPCSSPKIYSNLPDGNHNFQVRATALGGVSDPTPASFAWTIDIVPPDTTITANPPALSSSADPTIQFTSTEANSTFECKLDSSAFVSCASPKSYTGLSNGNHSFQVRAIDAAGNLDTTPASYNWNVSVPIGPRITVSPDTVLPGGNVTAAWSGIPNPSSTDWIGLYAQSAPNGSFLAWIYVSCSKSPGSPAASGSCNFAIPAALANGIYEMRLLANDGFGLIAAPSNPLTAGAPAVSIAASNNAAEPATNGLFTVTRTGSTTNALTVNFTVGGSATPGTDYVSIGTSVQIPAGLGTAAVPVTVNDDSTFEGNETVIVTLSSNANYTVASPNSATVTIADNEGPSISAAPPSLSRGATVTATWSGIVNPKPTDWIALYAVGAGNSSYLAWVYVSCSQTATVAKALGSCGLAIPANLANGSYNVRCLPTTDSTT